MKRELLQWLIFSVIVSLLPFLFVVLNGLTEGQLPILANLFSGGELQLISVGLAASAMGELLARRSTRKTLEVLAIGLAVVVLILASWWYANLTIKIQIGTPIHHGNVAIGSIYLYIAAFITSLCCKILTFLGSERNSDA